MEFGSMSCCRRATSDDAPKSIVKRVPPASIRMQVWKRPPLPKESPEPMNRAVAVTWSLRGLDNTLVHSRLGPRKGPRKRKSCADRTVDSSSHSWPASSL